LAGRALASFRALGHPWGIAAALSTRAKLAMIRGDCAAARRDAQQSLAIFRELGDRWGQLSGSAPQQRQPGTARSPTSCTETACG
jgi:hypothetical protein